MSEVLIEIGFSRWNEANFHVGSAIGDLSLEQMQELRKIIPVAIYVAEDMWHREREKKNPPSAEQGRASRNDIRFSEDFGTPYYGPEQEGEK